MKLLLLFCSCISLCAVQIKLGQEILHVEIADTHATMVKGLSGRNKLPEGTGMLFVYDSPQICKFWMKDTYIPLSIGFFNADNRLIHWEDMDPPSAGAALTIYESKRPALYALEVPKGWFEAHRLKPGMQFQFVDRN